MIVKILEVDELAKKIEEKDPNTLVIDVRDVDWKGGHIRGSLHFTIYDLETALDSLIKLYSMKDFNIVFHCMASQIRGPKAARLFAKSCPDNAKCNIFVLRGGYSAWLSRFIVSTKRDFFITDFEEDDSD